MQKPTIVIGVIGADCHAVGNKVLDRVFSQHNFNVINLRVMVSRTNISTPLLKPARRQSLFPLFTVTAKWTV